jgi:SAM-dependent methyltransferase
MNIEDPTHRTVAHYEQSAVEFQQGTKDHDVTQNYAALLDAIRDGGATTPYTILDVGCGPGRDLAYFGSLGHEAVGLDGSQAFVEQAQNDTGCKVLKQNFLNMDLPPGAFHGIFANASLFHVPSDNLSHVLNQLAETLKPNGVLFSSNPRGNNQEGWQDERYCVFHDYPAWADFMVGAGFIEIHHYYRPEGLPREQQPWLASVWRKVSLNVAVE